MCKQLRPYLEEIDRLGGTLETIERGKHYKLRVTTAKGAPVQLTAACTPSDRRNWLNDRANIRRTLATLRTKGPRP